MIVTEIKRVDYVDCTPETPMQLAWLNTLGGLDTWVFSRRQEYTLSVSEVDNFEPIINYLQTANGVQRTLKKDAYINVKLGYEGLTAQQVTGIKELLISPYVVLVNGSNQIVVVVKDGTFKFRDTGESKHSLEFEIVLPKLFTSSS